MRTRFAAIGLGLVAMLSLATGTAVAAVPVGTLDQQQTDTSWNALGLGVAVAQTFTAGAPGTLTTVGVNIQLYDTNASDFHVTGKIYETSGGLPTGSPLVTMTINTLVSTHTWYLFTFPTPPTSVAGTQYALVLEPASSMMWYGDCADSYGSGRALIDDGGWIDFATYGANHSLGETACVKDFAFETYVTAPTDATPPPTSAAPAGPSSEGGYPIGLYVAATLAGAVSLVILRRRLSTR